MTDTEAKALALTNEVRRDKGRVPYGAAYWPKRKESESLEALCRLMEEFDAYKREVSEVVRHLPNRPFVLDRFILPAPDPLTEAAADLAVTRDKLAEVLAKRGLVGEGV